MIQEEESMLTLMRSKSEDFTSNATCGLDMKDIGDNGFADNITIDSLPSLEYRAMSICGELPMHQSEQPQI